MILDRLNVLTALDVGDSPTLVQDTGSTSCIDQGVYGASFSTVDAGGVYVGPYLVVRLKAACTSGTSAATVTFVWQDSPDNSSWTDLFTSPAYTIAQLTTIPQMLLAVRIPATKQRYCRVAFRIGTEVLTAGTFQAFLVNDVEQIGLIQRGATQTVTMPTGAMNQTMGNSVLDS